MYVQILNNEEDIKKEFFRSRIGYESASNWFSNSWGDSYTIYVPDIVNNPLVLSSEEDKTYWEKRNLEFFVYERHYTEGDDRDEYTFTLYTTPNTLGTAIEFLYSIISKPLYNKIYRRNKLIRRLRKQLRSMK